MKACSDLSDSLSKCTVATGDNGASDCSQVEHCYLYANEAGSKNLISMGKSIHTYVGLPPRVFSFSRELILLMCKGLTVMIGR